MKSFTFQHARCLLLVAILAVGSSVWAADVEYTFASFTSADNVTLTAKESSPKITITLAKGSGSSQPAWSNSEARVYAKGSLKITSDSEKITKVVFTYEVNAKKGKSPTIDGVNGATNNGTWDSTNKTWSDATGDKEITFSTSGDAGNVGFTKVVITYGSSAPSYTITAQSNNDSYGTVSVSGTTITATPADCYQVKSGDAGYTVTSGTATVTHSGTANTLTVTPSTDCTIQVNFEKVSSNTYIDEIQGNADIELCGMHAAPSLTDKSASTTGTCAQQHWHFMGWVAEANKTNPTDANIIKAATSMTANGTTYYAVWAKGTTSGGGTSTTNTLTKSNSSWQGYTEDTQTDDKSATWSYKAAGQNESGTYFFGLNSDDNNYHIASPTFSGNITSIKAYVKNGSTKYARKIYLCSSNTTAKPTSGDLGETEITASNDKEVELTISGTFKQFYIYVSDALKFKYIAVTYGGSTTTYSDYITTCCENLGQINGPIILNHNILFTFC